MELLYFFGLLMIVAKSDAAVTFTNPASPTAACPTLESVAEGTDATVPVLTPVATATNGDIVYALPAGGDAASFEMADTATGVVTGAAGIVLDYETKTMYTLIITGTDDDNTAVSATCTIGISDVQPWFNGGATTIIVPDTQTSGDLTTLSCTDGGGSNTLAMTGGDDAGSDAKFSFAAGTLTKSAVALDATTKSSYLLTFTCVDDANTATTTVTICVNSESNCPSSKASINSGVLAGLIVPALLAIFRLS